MLEIMKDMYVTYKLNDTMIVAVFPAPGGGSDDLPVTEDGRYLSPGELAVAVCWAESQVAFLFSFEHYRDQKVQSAAEHDLLTAARQFLLMRMATLTTSFDANDHIMSGPNFHVEDKEERVPVFTMNERLRMARWCDEFGRKADKSFRK